ncbi:MAG: hypothetical protein WKF52_09155 [Sphingomicrobium sp.]
MQELGSTWGRSRLMGLEPGAIVPEHVDEAYGPPPSPCTGGE